VSYPKACECEIQRAVEALGVKNGGTDGGYYHADFSTEFKERFVAGQEAGVYALHTAISNA
jgi:hypothetical protein